MTRELITNWTDYQAAIDRCLASTSRTLWITEDDIGLLKLDSPGRLPLLKRLLNQPRTPDPALRVILRQADTLKARHPLLMNLLSSHGHLIAMQQFPEALGHLRDAMLIGDEYHGVIRFDREQPRSKLLLDESDELGLYRKRFQEIWAECNVVIGPSVLGL